LKGKILIIDDAKNIRLLTTKALTSEGYEVDSADNGLHGIELFQNNEYNLVFLDIRMPCLSGTEVLKRLRDIDGRIPVIMITAYPTVKNAVDCIKVGAVDYLRKPFKAEKLKQIVNEVLEREKLTTVGTDSYKGSMEYAKKCINERNFEEAIIYLKKAISINIENAEPFNIMGTVLEIEGELEGAMKYYNIALQLEPENEAVIENINRISR
jgi:DNA-binding NtrC family response regulator